jgi:uncharacterized protein (DUF2336 family)
MAPPLTQADVECLLAESSAPARAEVAEKVSREIDSASLSQAELRIAHDIVRIMAQDAELAVRQALSQSLRSARQLPHDVGLRLARDVEAVALPILVSSPVLTDEDLVALVNGGSSAKQEAIAGREDVSERVAESLVQEGSEAAVARLMGNAGANLTETSLGTAIDRFPDSEPVKTNIVHRANLPVTVAERLVVMVSEMLQSYLVRHHELPASLATDVVLRSRERATLHISDGSGEVELKRLLRQMHANRRLTPLLVMRALCLGDLPFFEVAMAVMANVPVANARILIQDAGPKGLASLYEKAGMPPRLLPALRVVLDAVRGTEFDGGEHNRTRVIARILTRLKDLPPEEAEYLLDKLADVLSVDDQTPSVAVP